MKRLLLLDIQWKRRPGGEGTENSDRQGCSRSIYLIRWYMHLPVVVFSLALPGGAQEPPVAFPDFTAFPVLHHFSYHNRIFPLPQFFLEETSTPWLLFNDSADACVMSPASDFIVSLMVNKDSTVIGSCLNSEVKKLPPGSPIGLTVALRWEQRDRAFRDEVEAIASLLVTGH